MGPFMKLFYAHYPALEKSFVDFVSTQRKNVLEPWLVVCASSILAKHLSASLAQQNGAVANIHFVTSSSVLRALDNEAGPALPEFPQNQLRDFLLKEILNEPDFHRYPLSRGFVQVLKSSLRDLADSLATPQVLEEHLQTFNDAALEQDKERLWWIARVYRRYLEREACVPGYRSYQSFFERALEQVEIANYLKKFTHIIWYGFYDMSGRQLELLKQIQAYYPVTVFAPYASYPAYHFAKKFFETNYLGNSQVQPVQLPSPGGLLPSLKYLFATKGSSPTSHVKIIPAADPDGEIFFVAKEILKLTEKEGIKLEDIAVLARTAEPYQEQLRHVFAQNCIALNASFTYGLKQFPLGVFCLNLFSLATQGFTREMVLSILDSPYFKCSEKSNWRHLASRSSASRDLNQWRDLLPITKDFNPSFLHWLEDCNTTLKELEKSISWKDGAQKALHFLQENVDENSITGKGREVFEAVCSCITSLAHYEAIRYEAHPGEFVRELLDALTSLSFQEADALRCGVTFTDVQHARGLSFKVVFLLGMEGKSFPLLQPEDPILRDRYRYVLRDVLGFWINQQSERADEERLLFFIAATMAQDRLYACYARTDNGGKETVPSIYLTELARACELDWKADAPAQISGRISERITAVPAVFLTPKEISYSCILSPDTALANYQVLGLLTPQKEQSLQAANQLSRFGALTLRDGVVSSAQAIFDRINQGAGFSPSSLEELAACPLKFFFHKGLYLEEPEDAMSRQELAPDKRGTAYHEVLQDFYQHLLRFGLTHQLFDAGIAQCMSQAFEKRYTRSSGQFFGIYPLIWEMILDEMRTQLIAFAQADMKDLGDYTPTFFEKEFSQEELPSVPFHLHGIIDRIDIDEKNKKFRVVDYKSSKKGGNNLVKAFFESLIFQPFLYVLAAQKMPELVGYTSAGSCLLSIRKSYCRRELSASEWEAMRPRAEQFLTQVAQIAKRGEFFLNPSNLCAYCPYGAICRRDHFASLMRARKSEASRQLEEARYV